MKEKIVYYNGMTCFDSCISHMLLREGLDPQIYFYDMWSTDWDETGLLIGDKLKVEHIYVKTVRKYMRTEMETFSVIDIDKFRYGGKKYSVIYSDPFYCHWHRLFRKEHNEHYSLFYERQDEDILVIDPMMSLDVKQFSKKDFEQGFFKLININLEGLEVPSNGEILSKIVLNAEKNILNLNKFFRDMCENMNLQLEYAGLENANYRIPLYRSLWSLMFRRELFSKFLIKYTNADSIASELQKVFEKWKNFRGALAYSYVEGTETLTRDLQNLIFELVETEIHISEEIISKINKGDICVYDYFRRDN